MIVVTDDRINSAIADLFEWSDAWGIRRSKEAEPDLVQPAQFEVKYCINEPIMLELGHRIIQLDRGDVYWEVDVRVLPVSSRVEGDHIFIRMEVEEMP